MQLKALELSYQTELQATDEQIATYRRQSADLLEVVKLQAIRATQTESPSEGEHGSSDGVSSDELNRIKITPQVKQAIVKGLDAYAPPVVKQPVLDVDAFESPQFEDISDP
ncbi:MAG: hypothetical protein HC840_05555 [Leptolyngbyaceae cyanobacterium RM2_2_4]|nr:hypothetical protein [Leptolyngbyaceae cyanobacterium SM1_4_3]NJN89956.1 hypothetical protein [Leptolyngbyaceae cyanobacterium SL_5_14]NJO49018.1 hypothetical protein [Leptolyngbyaceae cyanobacterium RM2_2_4]